jgi:hypothetical protein
MFPISTHTKDYPASNSCRNEFGNKATMPQSTISKCNPNPDWQIKIITGRHGLISTRQQHVFHIYVLLSDKTFSIALQLKWFWLTKQNALVHLELTH